MTEQSFSLNQNNGSKKKVTVPEHFVPTKLSFNFSFLTKDREYNLESKSLNKNITNALVKKIYSLSQSDFTVILNLRRESGLERLDEDEVNFRLHSNFKDSGRDQDCLDGYWCFRLNKLGRVIGKISGVTFYVLCIDAKFSVYKH